MQFGSTNKYATSEIATFLNGDYYNSLDPKIQNAIIETPVQQKDLKAYEGNNSTDWDTPRTQEHIKYFYLAGMNSQKQQKALTLQH